MNLFSEMTTKARGKTAPMIADSITKPDYGKVLAQKNSQNQLSQYCRLESHSRLESIGLAGFTPELLWENPSETVTLYRGEIQLWRAHLDEHVADLTSLSTLLSEDESMRAARYRFEKDRRRFILRRALLRMILSRYLGTEPELLQFTYGPCGKPALADPRDGDLQFNLSHSEGLALYAFSLDGAIGLDVERVRVIPEADQIGYRYFSPQELVAWRAHPRGQRPGAFLRLWSRKEASLKVNGRGLFAVTERIPSAQATKALDEASVWPRFSAPHNESVLYELTPATGYVGALALAIPEVVRA